MGQLADVGGEAKHFHFIEQGETGFEGGDAEEVRGAVFEGLVSGFELVRAVGDGDVFDRAAGEPGAAQFRERVVARDQGADAGGVAEEFVERERDIIDGTLAKA